MLKRSAIYGHWELRLNQDLERSTVGRQNQPDMAPQHSDKHVRRSSPTWNQKDSASFCQLVHAPCLPQLGGFGGDSSKTPHKREKCHLNVMVELPTRKPPPQDLRLETPKHWENDGEGEGCEGPEDVPLSVRRITFQPPFRVRSTEGAERQETLIRASLIFMGVAPSSRLAPNPISCDPATLRAL